MEMEGIESERQSLFTILTELYVNALDHGVLGLDSALKSSPSGFERYFREREQRMLQMVQGRVAFNLSVEQQGPYRSMLIRVEDSGNGFDYQDRLTNNPRQNTGFSGRGILLLEDLCESLQYKGNGSVAEAIYSWNTG
jgi:two-component sensor histidine kinase